MKNSLMLTVAILLIAGVASATPLVTEDFSYPDGPLLGNGTWFSHSGNAGDLLVANGQAVVTHGVPSDDETLPFIGSGTGDIYYAFDFSVDDPGVAWGTGTDFEYFAHFKDDGFGFRARLDVEAPLVGGDYTVGIASTTSTADAIWPMDLTYGMTYHAIARYNQDTNIAQLWIDASAYADLSILGADQSDPGTVITGFALRQSDSTVNETVRVDNLVVSESCDDMFTTCPPVATEMQSWGAVKGLFR